MCIWVEVFTCVYGVEVSMCVYVGGGICVCMWVEVSAFVCMCGWMYGYGEVPTSIYMYVCIVYTCMCCTRNLEVVVCQELCNCLGYT